MGEKCRGFVYFTVLGGTFQRNLGKNVAFMRQEMVWNRASEYQTVGWISPKIIKNFEGKFCHKKSEIACCELAKQGTKQESLQILPTFFLTRP